jgi:hypothetical protein
MKIGLFVDVFVVARCTEMQRAVVAKNLKSPDHCDRAGSSLALKMM